jgi:hypothetical protein
VTLPSPAAYAGFVTYGNGVLIAAANADTNGGVLFLRSTDGTTWSKINPIGTTGGSIQGLVYSKKLLIWVATILLSGESLKPIYSTDDGLTWNACNTGSIAFASPAGYGSQIAVNDNTGLFLMIANNSATNGVGVGNLAYSYDGINWSLRTTTQPFGDQISVVYYSPANDLWVVGMNNSLNGSSHPSVMSSSDTITWTNKNITTYDVRAIFYVPSISLWFGVLLGLGNAATSPDLITWTTISVSSSTGFLCNLIG